MKLIGFFISLFFSLVFFEIYFTFAEISPPVIYEENSAIKKSYKKNQSYLFFNEGFCIGETNQGGYLGKYFPPVRKPGTKRIALVGDSFIQAFQLFDRHFFAHFMEDSLKKFNPEILRFGYSGYQFENMEILYERIISQYSPDIMLYFLDSLDFSEDFSNDFPRYNLHGDSLVVDNFVVKNRSAAKLILSKSTLLTFLFAFSNSFTIGDLYKKTLGKYYSENPTEESSLNIYNKVSVLLLKKLSMMNKTHKVQNILVLNIRDRKTPSQYMNLIKELGIPYIDLSIPLDELNKKENPFFWKVTGLRGHWNHNAQKQIGAYLASQLVPFLKD